MNRSEINEVVQAYATMDFLAKIIFGQKFDHSQSLSLEIRNGSEKPLPIADFQNAMVLCALYKNASMILTHYGCTWQAPK